MGAIYRVRQGLANLRATMRDEDWALVEQHICGAERSLFERMEPADQRHSVQVLRHLLSEGIGDESLLKAALLHDVGKSQCRLGVVHRTLGVLLTALFGGIPSFLTWSPHGMGREAFHVIANHPRMGASMLARAGCDQRVWRLAELHQVDPALVRDVADEQWVRWALELLQRADSNS